MISVTFMYRLCAPDGQIRGCSMKTLYRPCICHVYILFCWHPTAVSDHNVPGGISDMRQTSLENNSELSLGKLYHVNCHRHTILLDKKKKFALLTILFIVEYALLPHLRILTSVPRPPCIFWPHAQVTRDSISYCRNFAGSSIGMGWGILNQL